MSDTLSLQKCKILSGSMLKLIAVIAMFIDHAALLLAAEIPALTAPLFALGGRTVTAYVLLRKIGRLAFPIFAFLAAEGFRHTRNQKRYLTGLLVAAAVSEVPFNLMLSGRVLYAGCQNVFFTLFFGVLMLYVLAQVERQWLQAVLMLCVAAVTVAGHVDHGLSGALLILLLYLLADHPAAQTVLAYPLLSGGVAALCAFAPIHLYNGKRGFVRSGWMKYAFYVFYPAHILLLVGIKLWLRQ